MPVSGEVAIIGVGTTKFGENLEMSYFDMVVEAAYQAYADAKVEPKDIQAGWLGTCYAYAYTTEGNAGISLAEPLALYPIPITRVANYCATGMDAVRNAAFAVAAGEFDMVLVVGVEKMRDVPPRGSLVSQHVGQGHPLYDKGRTAPGMFALIASRYREVFQPKIKDYMAMVSVKNHHNGSLNPKAHFQREVTMEQVLNAPMIADPIGLFDACPTTDGAAAAILTTVKKARELKGNDFTVIKGIGMATVGSYWGMQMWPDFDFVGFRSTQEAGRMAYKRAGITNPRKQIGAAEVHDCFTITEMVNYEDLGFCEKGTGWQLIADGVTALDGDLPVNPSGGLKSFGHPIGASGVRMIAEIYDQLLGRAGKHQIKDNSKMGLSHNLGGPGVVATVLIQGHP